MHWGDGGLFLMLKPAHSFRPREMLPKSPLCCVLQAFHRGYFRKSFGGEKTVFKILFIVDPRQKSDKTCQTMVPGFSGSSILLLWKSLTTNSCKKEFTCLLWPAKLMKVGLGKLKSSHHLALTLSMGIVSFILLVSPSKAHEEVLCRVGQCTCQLLDPKERPCSCLFHWTWVCSKEGFTVF